MTDTTAGEGVTPCPFCAGGATVSFGEHAFHDAVVRCLSCYAEGGVFDVDDGQADERGRNEIAATAAWNTRAAQPSASVETLIAEARAKLPDAGSEAIARHLYAYLAANPDMSNALWLIQGLKGVIGQERTEQTRIMGDFKDAAPGAAAVAAHDSFLRANPHLNESDPNVRA